MKRMVFSSLWLALNPGFENPSRKKLSIFGSMCWYQKRSEMAGNSIKLSPSNALSCDQFASCSGLFITCLYYLIFGINKPLPCCVVLAGSPHKTLNYRYLIRLFPLFRCCWPRQRRGLFTLATKYPLSRKGKAENFPM